MKQNCIVLMRKVGPREDEFGLGDPLHGDQTRIITQALQFLVWLHDVIATKPSLLGIWGGQRGLASCRSWRLLSEV